MSRVGPQGALGGWRAARARIGPLRFGLALGLAAWLPMLVLSALAGTAWGGVEVPFLANISTHVRLLLVVPLLAAAGAWASPHVERLLQHLEQSEIVPPAAVPGLREAAATWTRQFDSPGVLVLLAVAAVALSLPGSAFDLPADVTSWRHPGVAEGTAASAAGWWYQVVALPLMRLMFLRWGWRLVTWAGFLWRLSRLPLELRPTHPDLSGGLGYLAVVQSYFATATFAASAVGAAAYAEQMLHTGAPLAGITSTAIVTVVVSVVLLVGPLLFFTPRLLDTKRRALDTHGLLAARYTREFDRKWIGGAGPGEDLLGSADIQSLADLANSYEVVRRMRVTTFGLPLLMIFLVATVAPLLLLVPLAFPTEEILRRLLHLVLGG
jgi:hypothetical protein